MSGTFWWFPSLRRGSLRSRTTARRAARFTSPRRRSQIPSRRIAVAIANLMIRPKGIVWRGLLTTIGSSSSCVGRRSLPSPLPTRPKRRNAVRAKVTASVGVACHEWRLHEQGRCGYIRHPYPNLLVPLLLLHALCRRQSSVHVIEEQVSYSGTFAKPFATIGPVGKPVGEPPAGSIVISYSCAS